MLAQGPRARSRARWRSPTCPAPAAGRRGARSAAGSASRGPAPLRPRRCASSVDFPDPLRPTSAIRSPGAIDSSAPSSSGAPPSVTAMSLSCRRGGGMGRLSSASRRADRRLSGAKGKGSAGRSRVRRTRKSRTAPIWSSLRSAGAWPTPANSTNLALGPRCVISSATLARKHVGARAAQNERRAGDGVLERPEIDVGRPCRLVRVADVRIVVVAKAAAGLRARRWSVILRHCASVSAPKGRCSRARPPPSPRASRRSHRRR